MTQWLKITKKSHFVNFSNNFTFSLNTNAPNCTYEFLTQFLNCNKNETFFDNFQPLCSSSIHHRHSETINKAIVAHLVVFTSRHIAADDSRSNF